MPSIRINFGAAIALALLASGCSPAKTDGRAADTATTKGAQALKAPDPLLVAADRGRIAGDSTAQTWVVIASDFQCPYCREWHAGTYRKLVDEYVRTGKVRVAYLNFPLGQHRNAIPVANGAMCASAQNRFWEYHDELFATQERWSQMADARPLMDSIARLVKVDIPSWTECVESRRMLPLITADRDRAAAGGVESTPTFLIGSQAMRGALSIERMRPVIDAAIAANRSSAPQ